MERGVKLAVVVAAVVCLVAGLAWDRVVRTVVADGDDETAANANEAGDDLPADPGSRMEFTFVGSMTDPQPPTRGASPGSGSALSTPTAATNARPAVNDRRPADTQLVSNANMTPAATNSNAPAATGSASRERLYTVRTGDRLGSISKKFFGSEKYWRDIMTYNNIRDPRALRPNQVLKIPPINTNR